MKLISVNDIQRVEQIGTFQMRLVETKLTGCHIWNILGFKLRSFPFPRPSIESIHVRQLSDRRRLPKINYCEI